MSAEHENLGEIPAEQRRYTLPRWLIGLQAVGLVGVCLLGVLVFTESASISHRLLAAFLVAGFAVGLYSSCRYELVFSERQFTFRGLLWTPIVCRYEDVHEVRVSPGEPDRITRIYLRDWEHLNGSWRFIHLVVGEFYLSPTVITVPSPIVTDGTWRYDFSASTDTHRSAERKHELEMNAERDRNPD